MRLNLIRHGMTKGNEEKRYIGRTDEPLSEAGIAELRKIRYPECSELIVSPMKRCIMTAEIIYPHMSMKLCPEFAEIDFGKFEGRNYLELSDDPDYRKWIDSGGSLPFPGGEDIIDFKRRCICEFENICEEISADSVVSLIVHGGTIMSIMEKYLFPPCSYYDNQCGNGHGFIVDFDGVNMRRISEI